MGPGRLVAVPVRPSSPLDGAGRVSSCHRSASRWHAVPPLRYWLVGQVPLSVAAIASIEIRRPRGRATLAGAERAGGGSGM